MPCYHPVTAYRDKGNNLKFHETPDAQPIDLPCRWCIGCRLDRAREWALRIQHEAQMHKQTQFLTLTYEDAPISLVPRDAVLFLKRYRKAIAPQQIRYYGCGEYGEQTQRAHFHIIIFGHEFDDAKGYIRRDDGRWIQTSKQLEKLWPHGISTTGEVNQTTANYVARYILKKQKQTHAKYAIIDPDTGELTYRLPEFNFMSRGIGRTWYDQHKGDLYPHDYAIDKAGNKLPIPRFYDKLYHREGGDLETLKENRHEHGLAQRHNATHDRLRVREIVQTARTKSLMERKGIQ